ncbi:MAG: thioredoxin [Acidobacteria bacterium]|nr:thioredoxin [Acidobacteriota bacterium]
MASEKIIEINDNDSFKSKVLGSDQPVLVDFWAAWCGPCRMVAPTLDQLADEMDGSVRIAKVNVDDNQDLAVRFGVQSIPSFLLFKNGQMVDRMMGAMPKAAFEQFLQRNA